MLQVYRFLGPNGKIRYRLDLALDCLAGTYPEGFDSCPKSFRTALKAFRYAFNRGWKVI